MSLASFCTIILVLISLVTVYLNFENSMISDDVTASKNGHHNAFQICYFTVISILFTFFYEDEYAFFRMSSLLIGGLVLFWSYHCDAPFYSY